jgi:hypothetical protein
LAQTKRAIYFAAMVRVRYIVNQSEADAKLLKELSLVCVTFYYQPTTFNSTQSHSSINGRMKVHWVQKLKNVKMGMMTIMMKIRDVRDSRNKCVRF